MDVNSVPHTSARQIGRKLEELDRQIHDCLDDIRKNLRELEEVSGDGASRPANFADALRQALDKPSE